VRRSLLTVGSVAAATPDDPGQALAGRQKESGPGERCMSRNGADPRT